MRTGARRGDRLPSCRRGAFEECRINNSLFSSPIALRVKSTKWWTTPRSTGGKCATNSGKRLATSSRWFPISPTGLLIVAELSATSRRTMSKRRSSSAYKNTSELHCSEISNQFNSQSLLSLAGTSATCLARERRTCSSTRTAKDASLSATLRRRECTRCLSSPRCKISCLLHDSLPY